jgi:glycosyltransferase involved in cell wall biosynthesis
MKISVIIPTYNGAATLRQCLEAVLRSDYPDYEVIVVDDCSTDATSQIVAEFPCRVICHDVNRGAAVAKNTGAGAAEGDVIFFIDSDVVIRPDALSLIAEDLRDPSVDAVVGLLDKEMPYPEFGSQFKNLWMHYTYARLPEFVGVFYTSVAAARKAVFDSLGGFDTHYTGASITEDIELGMRLLSEGCRVKLDKRLAVVHLKRYTLWSLIRTDIARSAGLTKTLIRNKLGRTGRKYYASVPWFFQASVPVSALILLGLILLPIWPGQAGMLAAGALAAVWALNAPFLAFLGRARGLKFFVQSLLFLPVNLWVSGIGAVKGILDFARGKRY